MSCASGGSTSEQINQRHRQHRPGRTLARSRSYGGPRGGGSSGSSGGAADHTSFCAKLTPSGTNAIAVARHGGGSSLLATTFTVYVVQWGSHHTIQRVNLTGSAGGDGADATTRVRHRYDQRGHPGQHLVLDERLVRRQRPTATASGASPSRSVTASTSTTPRPPSPSAPSTPTRATCSSPCTPTAGSTSTGSSSPTATPPRPRHAFDVPGALVAETRDSSSTAGTRVPLQTQTVDGTGNAFQRSLWWSRHTDETDLDADRTGVGADWTAWLQSHRHRPAHAQPRLARRRRQRRLPDHHLPARLRRVHRHELHPAARPGSGRATTSS